MKKLFVLVLTGLILTACGGGGSTTTAPPVVAQKTSVVDGTWKIGVPVGDGTTRWTGTIAFSNGTVSQTSYLAGGTSWKDGTFSISGDSIVINYTTNNSAPTPTSISLTNNTTTWQINEITTYTFNINGNALTFNNGSVTNVYIK
jgi:hypothetical protein